MIRYQRLSGITTAGSNLPTITPRPEDVMAPIPGWALLLDPDFVAADKLTAMNRAMPNNNVAATVAGSIIGTGDWAAGGPKAFAQQAGASATAQATTPNLDVNPTAWSFFMPVREVLDQTSINAALLGNSGTAAAVAGQIWPNLYIRNDRKALVIGEWWRASQADMVSTNVAIRLLALHDFVPGTPAFVMATFSVANGLRLFINGKQAAVAATDKRPLTHGRIAGEWGTMRNSKLKAGMHGLLSIDLGAPENAGHRKVIEDFMLAKYGITRAV